jgi:uncharacterized membrane protein SirB2
MALCETLRWVHVGCVIATGAGFLARGALMQAGSPLLEARFARVAPHAIDTALLASAIAVAALARMPPLAHPWLVGKMVARAVYIVVGSIALRCGRTRAARSAAFASARLRVHRLRGADARSPVLAGAARLKGRGSRGTRVAPCGVRRCVRAAD